MVILQTILPAIKESDEPANKRKPQTFSKHIEHSNLNRKW